MKNFKRFVSIILSVLMLCSVFSGMGITVNGAEVATQSTSATSGSCGTNVTWSYDSTTYTLTISGTGTMTDYSDSSDAPWYLYRSSIKTVIIGNSVTSIGSYAFYNCTRLTSITIGDGVTSIGAYAFAGCDDLTNISIPNSVTSIGVSAFRWCVSLTSIVIPSSVTSIESTSFYSCEGLSKIEVDKDNGVFDSRNDCNAIIETKSNTLVKGCENTTIPDSVIVIGDYAFNYCGGLENITIPDSVKNIGHGAFYSSGLVNVIIPQSVIRIGDSAFEDCSRLTTLTIGNGVISIGHSAFCDCTNLSTLTIPNSVISIDDFAFLGCENLTIYGYKNSSAQKYANENNISFESLNIEIIAKKLNYTKTYGDKPFNLNVKENNATKVTYSTSNKKVAKVSSTGKVTIKGIGQAVVTVKAQNTAEVVTKKITITVIPKKVKIKKVEKLMQSGKKCLGISFTPQKNISGYELQYANNKTFKKASINNINKKTAGKVAIIRNKSNKHFVRIRSYKNVSGKKYYSKWSKISV